MSDAGLMAAGVVERQPTASALMAGVGLGLGSFVVGPLRALLPLARPYPLSAA